MEMTDDKPRIELNWVQASAASLAAVTSAVLLSTFGVAGTLIGAALGSLALTVGNAVYSYSINTTKHRVATAQAVAAARVGLARAAASERATTEHEPQTVQEDPGPARVVHGGNPGPEPEGSGSVLAALPWKRIGLVSAGVFVVAMVMILVFELVTGRAVSSYTGSDDRRNSIPVWGDRSTADQDPAPRDDNAPDGQESVAPEDDVSPPVEDEPTAEPTLPLSPTDSTDSSPAPSPDASEPSPDPVDPAPSDPTPSG
jgi:hypothetical protein